LISGIIICMKSVYVETSIFSYLTARPSTNLVSAARQRLTCDWWEKCRSRFDLFVSPLVESEASRGDPDAAKRRIAAMDGIPSLEVVPAVMELTFLCLVLAITGCVTSGPAVSKSKQGNLQINVTFPGEQPTPNAELYLDDMFIGNASPLMPVVYAKRGNRTVRVEAENYGTYERKIFILGDPNHQVLNVVLKQD